MSDLPLFIHRYVPAARRDDATDLNGYVWEDMSPGWKVVNWDEKALADFPSIHRFAALLVDQPDVFEQIVGVHLVVKWGGIFTPSWYSPVDTLERSIRTSPWYGEYFGAAEPQDPFWETFLSELYGPYFQKLADTDFIEILMLHVAGQYHFTGS